VTFCKTGGGTHSLYFDEKNLLFFYYEGSPSNAETEHIPPVEYACENIKCKNLELRKLMGEHTRDRTISLMPLTMRLQVCLSVKIVNNLLRKGTVSRDVHILRKGRSKVKPLSVSALIVFNIVNCFLFSYLRVNIFAAPILPNLKSLLNSE
jgi:hypothetical protein